VSELWNEIQDILNTENFPWFNIKKIALIKGNHIKNKISDINVPKNIHY